MNYQGFYINLDRRSDRRAEIEAELARCGLGGKYERFSAAEGNALGLSNPHLKPGEMGCFTSHYLLLKQNLANTKPLHFIEDDVVLSPTTGPIINAIIEQGMLEQCDILYTDVFVPVQAAAYKSYKKYFDAAATRDDATGKVTVKSFAVASLKGVPFGSTSSYIVNKNSIQKIHDFYERQINQEPLYSNDLFIRALGDAGLLRVGCIFPFVTSVNLDHIVATDIEHDYGQLSGLAAHLARYSFFIDADMDKCLHYLQRYMPLPAPTKHAQALNHLLAFSLTDAYQDF